jgi:hypothetical protein
MRYTVHKHPQVLNQLQNIVAQMKTWNVQAKFSPTDKQEIAKRITFHDHSDSSPNLIMAGVDGSGDFPSLTYEDSFIYLTTAEATVYKSNPTSGLEELQSDIAPIYSLAWIPEEPKFRQKKIDEAFENMVGMPLLDVILQSDYHALKSKLSKKPQHPGTLLKELIRPHAADSGNLGIQLRSTAELSAALKIINTISDVNFVLIDGTFSLPMVSRSGASLFFEHLKRLCCVQASAKGIGFFAVSKSPGLPGIDIIEEIARESQDLSPGQIAEHWFLRLPHPIHDKWKFPIVENRYIPPPNTITYLFRPHRTTGVMRLDIDESYWMKHLSTVKAEKGVFEKLDYAGHDQRCYGYPYPIKSAHDRVSLTSPERIAMRKSIIAAAVKAGMKRKLFYDASIATGHR